MRVPGRALSLNLLLFSLAAGWLGWWAARNPLPDGFQNEYLLMGNAFDLWGALVAGDTWHLRWHAYTGYWPFGLYVVPWPFLALLGQGRMALLLGNLVHLAVLMAAAHELRRRLRAPLAVPLLLLAPGVFGTLVRFEPNLAAIAWTAAGLAFLVRSEGLGRARDVALFGCALGIGLMMDRLSVAFFLLPALVPPALVCLQRRGLPVALGRLGAALGVALLWTLAWYREFFLRHAEELFSQAPVGEIDAAGELHTTEGPLSWLYYPLALVDSQAGPLMGGCALLALVLTAGAWLRRPRLDDPLLPLLASALGSIFFFTLVAKKQVFYTLPALVPLLVLLARQPRLAWLGLVGGLWSFLAVGLGWLPGGPWLPLAWVSPRHTLARPPSGQSWPLAEAMAALGPAIPSEEAPQVLVFSEDSTLFEGFVVLAAREAWPRAAVRGVVLDPVGTYENVERAVGMVWIGPAGRARPDAPSIQRELRADHYDPASLPPVDEVLLAALPTFVEVGRWSLVTADGARDLVVSVRAEVAVPPR